jgi:hypothetical protein
MTATALDRLMLRLSGRIGRRRRCASGIVASTSSGRPAVSLPNRKASPSAKRGASKRTALRVLSANNRCGAIAASAAASESCTCTRAYSW